MAEELAKTSSWGIGELERAAQYVARSGLFGVKRVEEAVSLMLLSQAEGVHPMRAVQEYHIINGRPALRADAMLARFLRAGGKVEWHALSNERAEATFSHPQGGSVRIAWTLEDAKRAGLLGKNGGNWEKYPRAMLRARVVSEGVRTVYPGVAVGVYTPEEVADFTAPEVTVVAEATPARLPQEQGEPVSDASLRAITTLAGRLGVDPIQEAGKLLGREVASLSELSEQEATQVMEDLKGRSITGEQVEALKALIESLGLSREEAREVASRFAKRSLESVRGLHHYEAEQLIAYLEALLEAGSDAGINAGERLRAWLTERADLPEPTNLEAEEL
jgi:hypothetical protein